ncbi:phosphotransferase enzyme family protein [Pseudogemmobacter faecipullorum]|uniref:Phosphotransferase n=1 Tax=Pseudogemmobacter faecipullorum TaxID=2755041 RepID=A0ABS8CLW6_9RHOB|nr:phosphotransferase [Pseudogemmobacter faecipullorum]MCB5410380.1 phosphotransferase [Pseudogemmobacter faecipullorum]
MAGLYDDAHVTRLTLAVRQLLPQWGLSPQTALHLLALSENATFLASDPDVPRQIVIRVHRPGYHSLAEICSELDWIAALKQDSRLILPATIAALSGERVISFEDQGQSRYVVASEFLEGVEPGPGTALIPGFRLLGAISARLHQHARTWQRPAGFTRKAWDYAGAFGENPVWGRWQDALDLTPEGREILSEAQECLGQRLAAYGQDPARYGVIHSDLRLANLLLRGEEIAVIDFDDSGFSWFVYDLASALTFCETEPEVPQMIQSWIEGYCEVHPLSGEDIAMIPSFLMYRRFTISAWISTHAETATARAAGLGQYTRETVEFARRYLSCEASPERNIYALWG